MSSKRSAALIGAAGVAFVILLAACGGGGSATPTTTDSNGGGGTLVVATTSAGPAESASSAAPSITYPNTAEAYTKAAIDAWKAHNSATLDALEVSGGVLHGLSTSKYNTDFFLAPNFCQGAAGSSYCLYFNKYGDELMLRVTNQLLGQPHAIVASSDSKFTPTTFPSDEVAYATEAIGAWGEGNDNRLKLLTNGLTSASITGLGLTPGAWTYDHAEGAAGSTYYVFTNGTHSLGVQFTNLDPNPAPTSGTAAQHRVLQIIKTS
jgi:hypothetical protein